MGQSTARPARTQGPIKPKSLIERRMTVDRQPGPRHHRCLAFPKVLGSSRHRHRAINQAWRGRRWRLPDRQRGHVPIPVRRPPPAYTAEAMRTRLQGVVVFNCVVRPDGRCSDIRTKSLDTMFGLDQQAIASAREWVFRPGTRTGEPVSVLVSLEIGFTIRRLREAS